MGNKMQSPHESRQLSENRKYTAVFKECNARNVNYQTISNLMIKSTQDQLG